MRKLQLPLLLMLLLGPGLLTPAAAQTPPPKKIVYSRRSEFQIPFKPGPDVHRLRSLRLYFSTDQGRSWQPSSTTAPNQRAFHFRADHDGLYWFTVQTLDLAGHYYPSTLEKAEPSLKVVVDTRPPEVKLRTLPARGREVGVAWQIADATFDPNMPDALRLDYRVVNGPAWQALAVEPSAAQHYWDPGVEGNIEVRLRVQDRAENWEDKIVLDGSTQGGVTSAEVPERKQPARFGPQPDTDVRMVKTKQFTLSYNVKETGPSNVSTVDIWYTQDGNSWQLYRKQECSKNGQPPPYTLDITVAEEGLYGFTLVVHSGVGLSDPPPQVGDKPQIWVEVDVTKPEVLLNTIVVGRGADKGKLTINWTARDKNLGRQPISLFFAADDKGQWTPIAEKVENTGRYVWKMPSEVPYKFFVKAEAIDKAGNVGTGMTTEAVAVDLSQPKVHIIGVEPVAK